VRASRSVLREAGGETPPAYSPALCVIRYRTLPLPRLKDLYRVADSCLVCGVCDIYRGHVCSAEQRQLEEHCPACDNLLMIWQAGEVLYAMARCNCSEIQCPFCPERCAFLEVPALLA